jgi:hypothetical protein
MQSILDIREAFDKLQQQHNLQDLLQSEPQPAENAGTTAAAGDAAAAAAEVLPAWAVKELLRRQYILLNSAELAVRVQHEAACLERDQLSGSCGRLKNVSSGMAE